MPVVDIKGVGKAQFPDEMPINDIKTFLRNKYFQDVAQGNSRALEPQPQTAANVNPSLIETAGQKVSDYLFDQGIISDRYRAQEVGKSIAGLGEFLPVIGDATAGDDFGKAAAKGDSLGMGVGLLGAVPVLGDVVKQGIKLSKPKQKVNQYGDSVQLTEIQKDGENIGAIEYLEDKDSITILRSDVVDSEVKKGYGTEAYTQLINKALKEGKTVKSDATVSDSAQGVYSKLKSSGYDVQKNPIEYNTRSGITTTDRLERIKQRESAPSKRDAQGNITSAPYRVKGDPVYTIKPSTNNTNNSVDDLASSIKKIDGIKTLSLFEDRKGDIKLDTIIVDKSKRKGGVGSKAMQDIIDYADKNNKKVKLTPAIQDDFQGTNLTS